MVLSSLLSAISCKNGETAENQPAETVVSEFDVTVLSDVIGEDGVRTVSVRPSGVCSTRIDISVKDGIVLNVAFTNGCSGNTQGIAKLIEGMAVEEAISRLEGIDCGGKGTSCPDQLSKALKYLQ